MIEKIKKLAERYFHDIVAIRRYIHQYPELSFNEYQTSAYIKSILEDWQIPFVDNIAETGIVVLLEGNNPTKKTIALRADFDALPITEENDIDYCSKNKGVMHACGHDAHTAMLLGVVKILNSLKKDWSGSIKFIFQPAEEQYPGGAKQMIKEGVLKSPNVDKMFGQHVFPELEVGKVGFLSGKYMASADEIEIIINGLGGHAALKNTYNSPIVPAAKLITSLDSHFSAFENIPAVFAIGFVEANGHCNVIPDCVCLKGTFRTIDEDFRSLAHIQMQDIAKEISRDYKVEINFKIHKGYPALVNDEAFTAQSIVYAKEYIGDTNVINLSQRMTAEDFAYYCQCIPCCFYRLGTANFSAGIQHGLHTSRFNIDEESLKIGMGLMAYLAIRS